MPTSPAHEPMLQWYDDHRRELPWRQPEVGGWAVLVSEIMLQQTPVQRVLGVYAAWMGRWPDPAALARETPGEAVRMWGRLGYPRRALRLHQAAVAVEERHGGMVPCSTAELRQLPGVGEYTAAAVAAFAYHQREIVLDTNVRRVLGRLFAGHQHPRASLTNAEREQARGVLPEDPHSSARWSVAVMELGALICTAAAPHCRQCPVSARCAWRLAGYPAYDGPPRRAQTYAGTDRQCRGAILSMLRESEGPVPAALVETTWTDAIQRERALASLVDDGLVVGADKGAWSLP